jgi:hypothetical protein
MDKKWRNILRYGFWGAVAVLLVWLCLRAVDWAAFREALHLCRWGWVLVSMLTGAIVFLIRAFRWRMQLTPLDPSTSVVTCYNAYTIGMASNLFLPRLGDVVRCGFITKNTAVSFDKSLGTMVVDRLWDALSLLFIGILLVTVFWGHFGGFIVDNYLGAFFSGGKMWLILAALLLLLAAVVFLLWKMREKGGFWARAWQFMRGIGDGLSSCLKMRHGYLFIVYTIFIWAGYWFMSYAILMALQDIEAFAPMGALDALFLMFAGSVSAIIPVPGGFGAYHSVVAGALSSVWGMPFATGMVFAVLAHESQVIVQAVCGIISYLHESFFRKP